MCNSKAQLMKTYTTKKKTINVYNNDVSNLYECWEAPVVIMADGPYGIKGFKGDLPTYENLSAWYEPHIIKWSALATPQTTLWLWNTEVGWAEIHRVLRQNNWSFVNCHIWNKGMAHIAGNANTKTLRKLPIVTEVCVQYVKNAVFYQNEKPLSMKEWLRAEWARTGIPFSKTNEICGVVDAATRKYFTTCNLWYYPPPDAFNKISVYANKYGKKEGKPYFSIDRKKPLSHSDWIRMRAIFKCPYGISNVWSQPPLNGQERIKKGKKSFHLNQKPLNLIKQIIEMSSDSGDVVWEPFGGLFTTAVASLELNRKCYSAEIDNEIYDVAVERIKQAEQKLPSK